MGPNINHATGCIHQVELHLVILQWAEFQLKNIHKVVTGLPAYFGELQWSLVAVVEGRVLCPIQ